MKRIMVSLLLWLAGVGVLRLPFNLVNLFGASLILFSGVVIAWEKQKSKAASHEAQSQP